jgi:hypothetical protein
VSHTASSGGGHNSARGFERCVALFDAIPALIPIEAQPPAWHCVGTGTIWHTLGAQRSPSTKVTYCPRACGTTRISENKIAASKPKRRIGCQDELELGASANGAHFNRCWRLFRSQCQIVPMPRLGTALKACRVRNFLWIMPIPEPSPPSRVACAKRALFTR